jgi:hypothetical protein
MNPITVNGVTYTSVAAAWRAQSPRNLKLVTVRWRLRDGWTADDAVTLGVVPPENRRTFKGLRHGA